MLAIAIAPRRENYGILYHQFTANVRLVRQTADPARIQFELESGSAFRIFGKHIKEFFYQLRDIKRVVKKLVKLII